MSTLTSVRKDWRFQFHQWFEYLVKHLSKFTKIAGDGKLRCWHQLFLVDVTFGMEKSGLNGKLISHRKKIAIEAHLTIVFAAQAISRMRNLLSQRSQ